MRFPLTTAVAVRLSSIALLALALVTPFANAQRSLDTFDAATIIGGDQDRFRVLADLDGDGRKDILSVFATQSTQSNAVVIVRAFRNLGTGALAIPGSFQVNFPVINGAPPTIHVAAGDLDQDGLDDYVIALDNTVYTYRSNGFTSYPTLLSTTVTPATMRGLLMVDFNSDGRMDVATLLSSQLRIFLSDPTGVGVLSGTLPLPTPQGPTIFAADVDGVGTRDIAVAGNIGAVLSQLLLVSVTGGVPTLAANITYPYMGMPMPTAGDIDGDADEDIVIFDMTDYRIFRRTGLTSFSMGALQSGGPATELVDIDFDGDLDGVCCGGGGGGLWYVFYNNIDSDFRIALNDGTGQFAVANTIKGLGSEHIAGVLDLDGDGHLDLIGGRCIYFGRGAVANPPSPIASVTVRPRDITDFDGDGDPDLHIGTPMAPFSNGPLRNVGSELLPAGSLTWPTPPPGTLWVGPGFPGDFDGDGREDVLVRQVTPSYAFIGMRLLRNVGGMFIDGGPAAAAGVDFTVMTSFLSVSTAPSNFLSADHSLTCDVDNDGDLDFIYRRNSQTFGPSTTNCSQVWINNGYGTFVPGQTFYLDFVQAAVDWDGNGTKDLVVTRHAGYLTGVVVLWLGLGNGQFVEAPNLLSASTTPESSRFGIADLTGDGRPDLVVLTTNNLRIMPNNGSTGVAFPINVDSWYYGGYALPPTLLCVFPVDVDADGMLDIVTNFGGDAPDSCVIYRRTGLNAQFAPRRQQMAQPQAMADVDGDGDPDVIGNSFVALGTRFANGVSGKQIQLQTGLPGTGGITPVLSDVGILRINESGALRLRHGLGGALAYLVLGNSMLPSPAFGGLLLIEPAAVMPIQLSGTPGVAGAGYFDILWTMPPTFAGVTIFHEVGIVDPGAAAGVATTNVLVSTIGS